MFGLALWLGLWLGLGLGLGAAGDAWGQAMAPAVGAPAGAAGGGVPASAAGAGVGVPTGPGGGGGGSAETYTVQDVSVDVVAESAAVAREKAIGEAQMVAFRRLLERIAPPGQAQGIAARTDQNRLASLIQGFEVAREQLSAVRYVATFTVRFRPDAVRALVGEHGGTVVETARPILVLPVAEEGGRPVLWEERTDWRSAWEDQNAADGEIPVLVPAGELADVTDIAAAEAVSGNSGRITGIARRYQAETVLVAVLRMPPAGAGAGAAAGAVGAGGPAGGAGGGEVVLTRYDSGTASASRTVPLALQSGEDPAAGLRRVISQVRRDLYRDWRGGGGSFEAVGTLAATATVANLDDWLTVRRVLAATPALVESTILLLTRTRVELQLRHRGEVARLQEALAIQGLELRPAGGTPAVKGTPVVWELRPRPGLALPAVGGPVPTPTSGLAPAMAPMSGGGGGVIPGGPGQIPYRQVPAAGSTLPPGVGAGRPTAVTAAPLPLESVR